MYPGMFRFYVAWVSTLLREDMIQAADRLSITRVLTSAAATERLERRTIDIKSNLVTTYWTR
jgi:hypothetical protein